MLKEVLFNVKLTMLKWKNKKRFPLYKKNVII